MEKDKLLEYMIWQRAAWNELIDQEKNIHESKAAILRNVSSQGVDLEAFKFWAEKP